MSHAMAGARCAIDDVEAVLGRTSEWAKARRVEVLLADARIVFGRDHLESAARHAERAKGAGTMVARTVALEALRYLSGRRQVADAIRIAGIRKGPGSVAVLVFGEANPDDLLADLGWSRDDAVLDAHGKDLAELGVSARERKTVDPERRADLALERVSLLDVER